MFAKCRNILIATVLTAGTVGGAAAFGVGAAPALAASACTAVWAGDGSGQTTSSSQYCPDTGGDGSGQTDPWVNNNVWQPGETCVNYDEKTKTCTDQGYQDLSETSNSDWTVKADLDGLASNGVDTNSYQNVISYPETAYELKTTVAMDSLPGVVGYGATEMPSDEGTVGTDDAYETAWDIWLNGRPDVNDGANEQEIMIWTDVHSQYPGGSQGTGTWTDPLTGCTYVPYWDGTRGHVVTLEIEAGDTCNPGAGDSYESGYVNIGAALSWLASHDDGNVDGGVDTYIPAFSGDTMYASDFGMEIVSTTGAESFSTYAWNQYWIGAPSSISPGTADGGAQQTASWPAVSGATTYKYELLDSDSGDVDASGSVTTTSVKVTISDGSYLWEVEACGAYGCGAVQTEYGLQNGW